MKVRADEARCGQVLRRTRNAGAIYYTLPAKRSGKRVETRRRFYIRKLEAKGAKATGREVDVLRKLEAGAVPMWRFRRYRDQQGNPCETKDLVAVPADYEFRLVKSKPGYP